MTVENEYAVTSLTNAISEINGRVTECGTRSRTTDGTWSRVNNGIIILQRSSEYINTVIALYIHAGCKQIVSCMQPLDK